MPTPLEEGWKAYDQQLPEGMTREWRDQLRGAFYAGAGTTLVVVQARGWAECCEEIAAEVVANMPPTNRQQR